VNQFTAAKDGVALSLFLRAAPCLQVRHWATARRSVWEKTVLAGLGRFVGLPIPFTPESRTHSAPLFLKQQSETTGP
jgi:hypothetical protein